MNTKRRAPKKADEEVVPGLAKAVFNKIITPKAGPSESVMTAWQFAEQIGCGQDRSREIIRRLISDGWATPVQQEYINMVGVKTRRPAYKFGKVTE